MKTPLNSANLINRNWFVNLYEGDISTDSTNLTLVDSCLNLQQTNSDLVYTDWKCLLNPNTTYSIQVLFRNDYYSTFTTKIEQHGILPTHGNDPNNLNGNNALGLLTLGNNYTINEHFSCNSLKDFYFCSSSTDTIFSLFSPSLNPVNWWATFEIDDFANISFDTINNFSTTNPLIQMFRGSVEDSCSLTPLSSPFNCLEPGTYSILVSGVGFLDNDILNTNLGKEIGLTINTTAIYPNQFNLETPSDIDLVNNLNPLSNNVLYSTTSNHFDCEEDLIPANQSCGNDINRAMYRLIHIDQSGKLELSKGNNFFNYQVFSGDIRNNSIDSTGITGATRHSCCFELFNLSIHRMCVDSGLYTIVTYGQTTDIGKMDSLKIKFNTITQNPFTNPATPDIMVSLSLSQLSSIGTTSKIDCTNNPDTILGLAPCNNLNQVTYKEFQLLDTLTVTFIPVGGFNAFNRIFAGRRSNNSITSLIEDCFTGVTTTLCRTLTPGWYTIVTYNQITYPHCSNNVGNNINMVINAEPPFDPLFNTFDKADSIEVVWSPRIDDTDSIPSQWQLISMEQEKFGCLDDLNFPPGVNSCSPIENRVSYRVLHIKKPSYLFLFNSNQFLQHNLYFGDITETSSPYLSIDTCFYMNKRMCIDSGKYTIASFATDASIKTTYGFQIYVDSLAQSKYDYANNAYNFGTIPNDGIAYFHNPSIPSDQFADYLNRPASNDFITCSTNSSIDEPNEYCFTPSYYSGERKTLWYTFQLDSPGVCTVNVNTLTPNKRNVSWAIYKCDNNDYPLTDSTTNDLTVVRRSVENCSNVNWEDSTHISFTVDACSYENERYVIILTNKDRSSEALAEEPNIQVNVSVKLDATPIHEVNYDYYSNANEINGNPTINCTQSYSNDTISYGVYSGCSADLTCATKSTFDPTNCGENTVWYKFNTIGSGSIKLNYFRDDLQLYEFDNLDVKLFRETIPGDSVNGLQAVPLSGTTFNNHPTISGNIDWGVGCFSTGTYYIMFTGCNFYESYVTPNIWLEHMIGDYCFDAVPLLITNEDSISVSASVDCWTIGEAPGEDGTNMGCLGSPNLKKSGWFQIFLDNDTIVDLDVSLQENTTVSPADISYRFATGNCSALTYQTCVNGAGFLTLNLKCRIDSFLYVQIVLPSTAEGTVDFTLETTYAQDTTCIPADPNIPNANFSFANFCENEPIIFTNNSTVGSAMTYEWNFGDGESSTDFNPIHYYSDSGTYLIQLIVDNSQFKDTAYNLINIQAGPEGTFTMPSQTCTFNPTLIQTLGTDLNTAADYEWFFQNYTTGTIEYKTGLDFLHQFTTPGYYKVCFSNNQQDSICPLIACDTIQVFGDFNDTTFLNTCNYLDSGTTIIYNTSIIGCDSNSITITQFLESINDTILNYTCLASNADTINFNGTTQFGCDSLYTEFIIYKKSFNDTVNQTSCFQADTGVFTMNDLSVFGCDSITTYSVILNPSYQDTITINSCFEADTGVLVTNLQTIEGCDSNTIEITNLSFPNALNNPLEDTTFCKEDIAYIYMDEDGFDFLWSDGSEGTSFSPSIAGVYFVEFTQNGTNCKIVDSLEVTFEQCEFDCEIIWPDAFTPNNDGLNDNFKAIRNTEDTEIIAFKIYNRWGEIVHNSIEPWDGSYNGVSQNEDVYTFFIQYQCEGEIENQSHLGIINLIR